MSKLQILITHKETSLSFDVNVPISFFYNFLFHLFHADFWSHRIRESSQDINFADAVIFPSSFPFFTNIKFFFLFFLFPFTFQAASKTVPPHSYEKTKRKNLLKDTSIWEYNSLTSFPFIFFLRFPSSLTRFHICVWRKLENFQMKRLPPVLIVFLFFFFDSISDKSAWLFTLHDNNFVSEWVGEWEDECTQYVHGEEKNERHIGRICFCEILDF